MGRHSIPGPDDDDEPDVESDLYGDYDDGEYQSDTPQSGDPDSDRDDEYSDDYVDAFSDGYRDDTYRDSAGSSYAADDDTDDDDYDDTYDESGGQYRDDRTRMDAETATFGAIDDPRPRFPQPPSGGHRNDGEWTGSHRTVTPGRRGVSVGVIAALVTVVAIVGGFILWKFFGDALSDRSDAAASRCVEGDANVAVLADPAIADYVGQFAKKFNETAGPVGDHCVKVNVKAAESDAVIAGLSGQWPADLGDKPALWIPGSSVSAARLQAAAGPQTVSASNSLVKSPVLLAIRPQLKSALDKQDWGSLPGLQADPAALDNLGLPGWGSLKLALPKTGDSDAAYLAAEAVASAAAPSGAPPTDGVGAVSRLAGGAPKLPSDSLDDAMSALLDGDDPATAAVHAVVSTEQQVIHRAVDVPDAKNVLASWLPPGPAAVADFPAVVLAGDWLEQEQVSAASEFERFMRKPEQLGELAKAGFRTDGGTPPTSDVTAAAPLSQTLSVGDDAARVSLANALSTPANGSAVTIMLDRSLNLAPVVTALNQRIEALPPTAAVGLTTFDGSSSTTQINLGALSDDVEGKPRSEVLTSTLAGLTSAPGGAVSFTTLRNVYGDALNNFKQGQPNSVLIITSGPHTDQSLDAAGLQDLIRNSADPAKPVAVDVINVGNDPDRPTWESVAQISGGQYQNVPASDSPEMVTAINTMLG